MRYQYKQMQQQQMQANSRALIKADNKLFRVQNPIRNELTTAILFLFKFHLKNSIKNDFISKLSISLKEARETKYWIELLRETDYLTDKEANNILEDLIEVIKLLVSIIKTTKANQMNGKFKMENGK